MTGRPQLHNTPLQTQSVLVSSYVTAYAQVQHVTASTYKGIPLGLKGMSVHVKLALVCSPWPDRCRIAELARACMKYNPPFLSHLGVRLVRQNSVHAAAGRSDHLAGMHDRMPKCIPPFLPHLGTLMSSEAKQAGKSAIASQQAHHALM